MSKGGKPKDVFDVERIRQIIQLMEQHDLSGEHSDMVAELAEMFQKFAERANVLPLNPNKKQKNEKTDFFIYTPQ